MPWVDGPAHNRRTTRTLPLRFPLGRRLPRLCPLQSSAETPRARRFQDSYHSPAKSRWLGQARATAEKPSKSAGVFSDWPRGRKPIATAAALVLGLVAMQVTMELPDEVARQWGDT